MVRLGGVAQLTLHAVCPGLRAQGIWLCLPPPPHPKPHPPTPDFTASVKLLSGEHSPSGAGHWLAA